MEITQEEYDILIKNQRKVLRFLELLDAKDWEDFDLKIEFHKNFIKQEKLKEKIQSKNNDKI